MVMQMNGRGLSTLVQFVWIHAVSISLAHVYFLGSASGNKPGLGVMETAYIPHNHTLTVYYYR